MTNLYDPERLVESRIAELRRRGPEAPPPREIPAVRRIPLRERVAATLIAVAVRLAPG